MKKVRIFFAAAALLLMTAGVFAGKSRFTTGTATDIYYLKGTQYELVASGITSTVLGYNTVPPISNQSSFNPNTSGDNTDHPLYYTGDGTHYYPVYY